MTSKNMEARREAFERWYNENDPEKIRSMAKISWEDVHDFMFSAYNAALDSICVELPDDCEEFSDRRAAIQACKEALTAAGVAYK